jgi:hypothetical protein
MFGISKEEAKSIMSDMIEEAFDKLGVSYYPGIGEAKVYENFNEYPLVFFNDYEKPFKEIAEALKRIRENQEKLFELAKVLGYEYQVETQKEGWVKKTK